eukprot:m.108621 g.108621  ORF g.108621 m.108621 type:complete len:145 (+) comp12813_c0_seq2:949-1383(+)
MMCRTPSNSTRWNMVTPNQAYGQSGEFDVNATWSIRTTRDTGDDPMERSGFWSLRNYSAAANGFAPIVFATWGQGFVSAAIRMFTSWTGSPATCPAIISGQLAHYANTAATIGSICGGPGGRVGPPGLPRDSRVNWFIRVTPGA